MNYISLIVFSCWSVSSLKYAQDYPQQFGAIISGLAHVSEIGQFTEVSGFLASLPGGASAWGSYSDTINETGWASLKIHSNVSESDDAQAYAAGFLEGTLTFGRIEEFLDNMVGHDWGWPSRLDQFVDANTKWITEQVQANPSSEYWRLVGLSYRQLQGMYDGYCNATQHAGHQAVNFNKFYSLTLDGDLYDLCDPNCYGPCTGNLGHRKNSSSGHCSVLVKVTSDDLKIAHTTWSSFESMTRIYKLMDLQFTGVKLASKVMTFASYPGTMVSVDDFYQTDAGLVITETTEANNNASLWKFVQPNTVLYWARNLIANRLASTGLDWVKNFMLYNSGTYNNQWIIVDLKQFSQSNASNLHVVRGTPKLNPGLLFILEQLPGSYSRSQDMTEFLSNHSFWVSYNRAFFPEIFNISNQWELVSKMGDHYTFNLTARAQLFAQLQSSVVDDSSLQTVMRHNDFLHDEVGSQACANGGRSGSNAIAERGDLTLPSSNCIPDVAAQDEASTDLKYTTWTMSKRSPLSSMAQAGPPYNPLPVFSWSQSPEFISKLPHRGQPDRWDFDYVLFEW